MGFGNLGVPGAIEMSSGFSGGNPWDDSFGGPTTSWSDMYKSGMLDKPYYSPGDDGGFSGGFSKNFGNALKFLKSYPGGREKEEDDPYKPVTLGPSGGLAINPLSKGKHLAQWQHPTATIIPAQQSSGGGGLGGMIGNIVGTVAGSTMGPLGAKIGGSIGGAIGGSF